MQNYEWKQVSRTPIDLDEAYKLLMERRNLNKGLLNNETKTRDILKVPEDLGVEKKGIRAFAAIISDLLSKKKGVIIHGDYDVDGITSTAVAYEGLRNIGFSSENIITFIPNRFDNGYGFSDSSLNHLSNKYSVSQYPLILLVDCGITAVEQVKKARKLGYKVVTIDHHLKQKKKPNANILFWNSSLTASVLTYIVFKYLEIKILGKTNIKNSLDLAALGYVCDLGDLSSPVGHTITKEGLDVLNQDTRPGLIGISQANKKLRAYDLGWIIGPKINAAGRLDDASAALDLLLSKNIDENARELSRLNEDRQDKTKEMYELALNGLSNKKYIGLDENHRVAVVHSESFHEGVIGLIASKVTKSLYKPSMCIAWDGKVGKGSCRSVEGVNIVNLLQEVSSTLLNYGGHAMAAGFSIEKKSYQEFEEQLLNVSAKLVDLETLKPKVDYDFNLSPTMLTYDLLEFIEKMEPYGNGNPKPSFVLKNSSLDNFKLMGKGGDHLSFTVSGTSARAVYFGGGKILSQLTNKDTYDILFEFEKNEWKGSVYPQLLVKGVKPSEF